MTNDTNYAYTENGAVTHKTTRSALLDMFALCGAYRKRSDEDCILAFKNALQENEVYAMKCLFYLRDVRGGQGERRFFKVCMRWLAEYEPDAVLRNLELIPEYGRWDDLYCLDGTGVEAEMYEFIKKQLTLDFECKTPSLLAKWLKSENASSKETKRLGNKTRVAMGMNHKQYRKTLSMLRERINIVERLMSENRWDEIEFDKIPSRAGLIYKNAFARRDIIQKKYEAFAKDTTKKVNAEVLNPVDIAAKVFSHGYWSKPNFSDTDIAMLQKYWDNLKDYYNGRQENGIAIVDTSGSMYGQPLYAAISMGAYIAERGHGPFANHFITFSNNPELVKFEGVNIVDKFQRASKADWGGSTNLQGVFDLMLSTARRNHTPQEDMPETLYIFSDMEFNRCVNTSGRPGISRFSGSNSTEGEINTLLEYISKEWSAYGYRMPRVIFWNLDARHQNIPAIGPRFSYVSGFSMNMVEQILSGKDGYDLMMEKLNTERYAPVH
jgi:hypothetical protein